MLKLTYCASAPLLTISKNSSIEKKIKHKLSDGSNERENRIQDANCFPFLKNDTD